ncbi:MAG: AraC family transcriptional regulator [Pseudomonadales bacterium]|nr:AraC family transcriptional regulator [Pseudomonadales bacterium]
MPKNFENLALFPDSELELIRDFMMKEGVPESKWSFGSGLDPSHLKSPSNAISLKQFDVLYRNLYRFAERPGLGIDFGLALNLSRWGMLTAALLCANNLGHALSIADEFREILRSRFTLEHKIKGNMAIISLEPKSDMRYPVHEVFAYEIFIGMLKTQISQLIAQPFRFSEVKLPYAKPNSAIHYQKLSEKPVRFNAPCGQLFIPLDLMNKPLPMANRVTRNMIISQCREELERVINARSGDIVFMVRSLLARYEGKLPDLADVANQLSMSPRTLRRKLQQEQVQFRQLSEQQRQQTILLLLSSTDLSLKEIAKRSGFKDSTTFHKAFKRWTGETPAQYRDNLETIKSDSTN